ncbi:hypothetical protein POM88_036612 [Heracleum sosnowskyi]|uniref:Uncharacterized protein n=1 Tax=Heracleum sosnowskyi TaxID=360622 RepID=A0AAD8HNH8_9APIA|nr:hypothetical protein POM88_036612 [Heracleum sosnowskyi]
MCRNIPLKVWNFPALLSLELDYVDFPTNMSDIFPTLVNLQNLTVYFTRSSMEQHHAISCPRLLNLNIRIHRSNSFYGNTKVLAPKLCNFTCLVILSVTFEVPELENVKIMLHGLGNVKNLTLGLDSMKALSVISDLASSSPFYELKYVKLPHGNNESSLSSALRSYLIGGSPRATIVTTVPQSNMIPRTVAVSVTSQDAVLQEPLAGPTKELCDSQYIHQTLNVGTVSMDVQEEHVVEDSIVDADRVRPIDSSESGIQCKLGVCRLNYIEHLCFSNPLIPELHAIDCRISKDKSKLQELQAHLQDLHARVDDAQTKLQDLQTLRAEKLTEIEKAFGTIGTCVEDHKQLTNDRQTI